MFVCTLSHVRLLATPWTVAHQAPPSMGFPRQNTGAGCHFLLRRSFPTQRRNSCLLCLLHGQADSLPAEPRGEPHTYFYVYNIFTISIFRREDECEERVKRLSEELRMLAMLERGEAKEGPG